MSGVNQPVQSSPPRSSHSRMKLPRPSWRAILGTLIVLTGVAAGVVTVLARQQEAWELVRVGAAASLVCVLLMIVFVVPPLTRSARAEAARLDLPFQLTGGGLLFLGLFFVVVFVAWKSGNNLLFLIFSLLASTLFVAWAAARAALGDLIVSARFPDHIFAGEAAPVIVTLHNTKRLLPSFSILIEARHRVEDANANPWLRWAGPRFAKRVLAYFVYVPRRAKVEQRVEQTFPVRGHVLVTGFELSTRFPFNFFRLRRRLSARHVDLIIYPKPERASDELHLLPMNAGRLASARRGTGHDLYSLRDYQPQDDVRHIDWKSTARTRRLVVREFTSEDERRVHIIFDTRTHDGEEAGKTFAERFERGVTLAASLATHFIDERADVKLTLGEEEGRHGEGREHLYASLRRLALVAPDLSSASDEPAAVYWQRIAPLVTPDARGNYVILITAAPRGSIPSNIWRTSHVIFL